MAAVSGILAAHTAIIAAATTTQDSGVWPYVPSFAVSFIAVILYSIVTALLLACMVQYKACWFVALILGVVMETMGFGARTRNTQDLNNNGLYKMQLCCTILAPIFTAAAEYILLGRIMGYVGGAAALLAKPDVDSQSSQATIKHAQDLLNLGDNILLAGLCVNLASFFVFVLQVRYFDYKTRQDRSVDGASSSTPFYRVIEFSQGWFGYLPTHEAYFYGLDSLVILLASAVYIWFWPSKYIPADKHIRLGQDGREWREMTPRQKKVQALEEAERRKDGSGEVSVREVREEGDVEAQ
ncbi:hypothetical protein DACRYDRAFT_107073 [Dacryopinax primogenitus]|uniref:RTA1-domain-containing protein n=1 Tax=Dacryopinax primogenitus (strain DJM 731) TaxID=1858805 RepID=M5FW80_DACPD|nr:uncharacterized protein DACRYDRAFT_107073 [Dacryopinax primogenitus]EJU02136.1 hypothetical protein DACRYDRAFT_107073 [Dacryopinax primogenitus]